jgi:hypothetical protein
VRRCDRMGLMGYGRPRVPRAGWRVGRAVGRDVGLQNGFSIPRPGRRHMSVANRGVPSMPNRVTSPAASLRAAYLRAPLGLLSLAQVAPITYMPRPGKSYAAISTPFIRLFRPST